MSIPCLLIHPSPLPSSSWFSSSFSPCFRDNDSTNFFLFVFFFLFTSFVFYVPVFFAVFFPLFPVFFPLFPAFFVALLHSLPHPLLHPFQHSSALGLRARNQENKISHTSKSTKLIEFAFTKPKKTSIISTLQIQATALSCQRKESGISSNTSRAQILNED